MQKQRNFLRKFRCFCITKSTYFCTHLFFSYNNIYQFYFFRIVQVVFTKSHETSIDNLLKKHKFLSALIKAFGDPFKSGTSSSSPQRVACKGYILQICNLIRFAADVQTSGSLKIWLSNHDLWKTFLPQLRYTTTHINLLIIFFQIHIHLLFTAESSE